jgi:3-hydroxyisobutyrate dehydrogenase
MRVGFVGVGDLGGAMATMIARAGFDLTLCARRPESLSQFDGSGVHVASTIRELGDQIDVACLCVFDAADVTDVLFEQGLARSLRPGSTVLIHSTVAPSVCIDAAAALAERGIDTLDAPIGGGAHHALERRLTVMAGGSGSVLNRVRPIFDAYARQVHHLGGIGAGQRTKLVNNITHLINIHQGLRALSTLETVGVDRDKARAVLIASSGQSFAMTETIPRLLEIGLPHFIRMMRKEVTSFRTMIHPDDRASASLAAAAEDAVHHLRELVAYLECGET